MISPEAKKLFEKLKKEAEASGYNLNPDEDLVLDLMEGLITNRQRYGYQSCPCRLADGIRGKDLDMICPCDYRDADLDEYGACYCALYVSEEVAAGRLELKPVPERRNAESSKTAGINDQDTARFTGRSLPVWRCRICGYLCARPEPPLKCPICKADKDRFEKFE
ncbi:MAG TPA: ferredoxin-thioredoxin reductase catalytic domain-containing protein [Myxococcota bacterium]|nr:ferredoxin-thioredoxin reductase catalytic domain-containing protein [Myxococcota bacterium]